MRRFLTWNGILWKYRNVLNIVGWMMCLHLPVAATVGVCALMYEIYTYLSDPHLNQWKLGGIIVLSAALCIISYATSTTALPEIRTIQRVIITQRDRRHKACLVVLTDIDNATGKSGTERVASWIILFRFSYVVASQHRQRNGSHVEFNYLGNSPSLDNHRQRQRRPG